MTKKILLLFVIVLNALLASFAQDTLPKFSVRNVGANRIVIGWVNRFESVKQISIQRSFDSLRNFKTILTVADPELPENGFADTKANTDNMFYRLYIQLDKGIFLFSNSKRPVRDTVVRKELVKTDVPGITAPVIIKDSVVIGPVNNNNRPKADIYIPSKRIYTFRDGYVRVLLPDDKDRQYSIKFFNTDNTLLFELKDVKEKDFKIDKSNFYHSGWFTFELYANGELLEKNKFYLPKEF